ncbi:hypothetical protein Aeh1ORF014c [Aeromonas phage Aeh1]|uniref:Uncharacterized protein n=1 Tax=Aeromonas phage Aeh1 TaxID=2880362 RepID=Q76Z76_9CAUD|nr:hypothetical protein Aeh1p015 [Aeromonas phage Aeh1]AAQ17670.1 hypothetical protein Aeh1ORF014c [Aeromonas phage Aeh1]
MKIDLQKVHTAVFANGERRDDKLINLVKSTNRLWKFGTSMHVGTYSKHYHEIRDGIDKNGFHIHNGYRLTGFVHAKCNYSGRESWFDIFKGFSTCAGIILGDMDKVVDPVLILREYDKQVKPKTRQWNDRGARKHAYGSRNRHIFGKFFAYTESKRKQDLSYSDYERELDMEYYDDGIYDQCLEPWCDIPVPQIRRNDLVDAFMHREAWWDNAGRSVEKSWKYQSKRRHQWKPKKEIIETF